MECKHNWLKPEGTRTRCTLCGRDGYISLDVDVSELSRKASLLMNASINNPLEVSDLDQIVDSIDVALATFPKVEWVSISDERGKAEISPVSGKAESPLDASDESEFEYKLSCLLSYTTGGLLSKPTYHIDTMYEAVEDHIERQVQRRLIEERDLALNNTTGDESNKAIIELENYAFETDARLAQALERISEWEQVAEDQRNLIKTLEAELDTLYSNANCPECKRLWDEAERVKEERDVAQKCLEFERAECKKEKLHMSKRIRDLEADQSDSEYELTAARALNRHAPTMERLRINELETKEIEQRYQIADLKAEIEILRSKASQHESTLQATIEARDQLRDRVAELEADLERRNEHIDRLNEKRFAVIDANIALHETRDQFKAHLKTLIEAVYKWAARPTKDGAKELRRIAAEIDYKAVHETGDTDGL
jgi:DNA repair exonuclease SbcCD ATPase subunit